MAELRGTGRTGPPERRSIDPSVEIKERVLPQPEVAPVIWALDAFPDQAELHQKTACALKSFFPTSPIYPVYVMSEESFTDQGFSTFLRPALKPMATKALTHLLDDSPCADLNLKSPRVLVEPSTSRTACARRLLRFANKVGAGHIVVGSHGQKGMMRYLLGSFSEAIIDDSRVPVIIAGPMAAVDPRPIEAIVFATDFSPACSSAFDQVLDLAMSLSAELHIYHRSTMPIDPVLQSGVYMFGGGWVSAEAYLSQAPDDHTSEAERFIRAAQSRGVTTRYICENFSEPTAEAIVQYVRHLSTPTEESGVSIGACLAMITQSGPLASAFLGSVTRDVIKTSPCPVYLIPRNA